MRPGSTHSIFSERTVCRANNVPATENYARALIESQFLVTKWSPSSFTSPWIRIAGSTAFFIASDATSSG